MSEEEILRIRRAECKNGEPKTTSPRPDLETKEGVVQASWSVGIVNHGGFDDLERCLTSIKRQSLPSDGIVVFDTGVEPGRLRSIQTVHSDVCFESGPNLGYAGGANRILDRLSAASSTPDFCLILNPDIELDANFVRDLLAAMRRHPDVAIGGGKLHRRDRKTIDSAGIVFPRNGRPRDRGSDQADVGQFDAAEFVDGISGAAMMIRFDALPNLRILGEVFDEDFFMYHEDTDLCWRARRLGFRILYEPSARAIHARGWQKGGRQEIADSIRRHSFKNHYLQLVKNQTPKEFMRNLPWLLGWEILRIGFVLIKDRAMWAAYRDAWRALPRALEKRQIIQIQARASQDSSETRSSS